MDLLKLKELGTIKGDFDRPDEFKAKINAAKLVREYAQANIQPLI